MPYYNVTGMHSHRHPFYGEDMQQEPLITPPAKTAGPCRCHHGHHGHGHHHGFLAGALVAAAIVGGVYFIFKILNKPAPALPPPL